MQHFSASHPTERSEFARAPETARPLDLPSSRVRVHPSVRSFALLRREGSEEVNSYFMTQGGEIIFPAAEVLSAAP